MVIGLQPLSTFAVYFLVVMGIHCTRPPDVCPSMCQCTNDGIAIRNVICANVELSTLPVEEFSGLSFTRVLVIFGNHLTIINTTFPQMNLLEELSLSNNSIRSVEPLTFQQLAQLSKLDLSHNDLTSTPPISAFDKSNKISELNLSHNQISRLENGSFTKLRELKSLDLFNNSIEFISVNSFQGLEKVVFLNLGGNRISQLHPSTFGAGLSQLTDLNLAANRISEIVQHSFIRMTNLLILNLSNNKLSYASSDTFEGLQQLKSLRLSDNRIRYLSERWTAQLPNLEYLDLSGNPLFELKQYHLSPAPKLIKMDLMRMPELEVVRLKALSDMPALRSISFNQSLKLRDLNPDAFVKSQMVESVDVAGCNLQWLSRKLIKDSLPNLKSLSLQNNQWRCDCNLKWLSVFMKENPHIFSEDLKNILCAYPDVMRGKALIEEDVFHRQNCSNASISHYIPNVSFRLGSTALLECQAEGNPKPEVSWYTPVNNVLHWSSASVPVELNTFASVSHPAFHDSEGTPLTSKRLQVLRNGNLFISPVETEDAGVYACVVGNSLGNETVYMSMTLDFEVLQHIKIVSILVGLAVSVAFMLLMLVVQLVQMILNRWGWCCCRAALPPKAKRIRKMLESVEHYKSQQLDRLRDNYNMQVQRIKDNCTQQMEKLRDSYSSQTERLRDFRDYGTHQIDRIRDQYYEQVRRVRDYSTQQMSRVRENYVVQRNRIRKFSAHQLFKLRENYKVQQLHLNKILENLNLESCRTVCARTDSVMFNSEVISMDATFPADIDFPQPIPILPSSLSSDLGDIELQKFELPTLTHLSRVPLDANIDDIDYELDEDDDSVCFQDAVDGTELQENQETFVVDPNDSDNDRPPNDIIV